MKYCFMALCLSIPFLSHLALAQSAQIEDGRLKIQTHLWQEESEGSYQLRHILVQHGFQIEDGFGKGEGFVRTREAFSPLEIYNYLYNDGLYAFTIFLPVDDNEPFVAFGEGGFISFEGIAARKLFEVVRLYVPLNDNSNPNLEQYEWSNSYCDKTRREPITYRCWISL
ncbi:MAG: hypothetical protein OXB88_05985 [Bacteriovoracales bacterium]|nr:hypothetical protein [Bacteriovoracales bacterium]